MQRCQDPWLLPSADLAAKLQACEIELECTRQEVVKKNVQLQQCRSTIDYKERQIKTQARRQRDIERIHKELIQEYEQQVIALRKEIDSIKQSQEQVHSNYMQLQNKYVAEQRTSDSSNRLLQAIDELDKQLRNSSASLPSPFINAAVTSGETVDILKENCLHLQEKLKRLLSGGNQESDSLDLLQVEVHHSLNVTKYVMDQLIVLETSIQSALNGTKGVAEPGGHNEAPCINSPNKMVTNHRNLPLIPHWFNEWSSSLESRSSNPEFMSEESTYVDQLKEKISIHVNTLECLVGKVVQKQMLRRTLI